MTKPLVHITYAEVKAKARKAFLKGKLQCQQSDYFGDCAYTGPCAIGVALKPSIREVLDNSGQGRFDDTGIDALLEAGIVAAPARDWPHLKRLQERHDGADDDDGLDALRRLLGIKKSEMAS